MMKSRMKKFAENVRKFRAIKKLSQENLSELADLSQQYICAIENEKVNPSFETIWKLCDAFGVTPNDLML